MTRRTAGIVSVIVMLLVSIIGPSSAVDASWRTINQLEIDDSASSVCRDGMRLRLGEIHIPFVTTLADVQSIPADSVRTIEFTAASPAPPFGSGSSGRLFDFPFPPESVAAQRTLTMRKAPIWMVTIDGRPGVELSDYVLGAQIFDAYSGTFFIPWAVELAPAPPSRWSWMTRADRTTRPSTLSRIVMCFPHLPASR